MTQQHESILRLPAQVKQDVSAYRAGVEKFQRGELTAAEFRAFNAGMGVYEHRQDGRYMVRVRLGAGIALPEHLRCIAELSKAHASGVLHVTTRQDIQIHGVALADIATIHEKLLAAGLSARGGGGNTVRNVTSCPRSMVCPNAIVDVAPYAIAAAEYLLQSKSSYNLPRKFKIAFSGCSSDCAFASVNDIGFFAHVKDGRDGFTVYAGGGLGAHPAAGVLVEEFIGVAEVFEVVEAVKRLFDRLGDRANRSRARLRFVLSRLGADAFVVEYRKERDAVRREGLVGTVPAIRRRAPVRIVPAEPQALPPGVLAERQPGRFTLRLQLSNGSVPSDDLVRIGEIADRFGLGLVLTTQQQDLLIPGVPANRVAEAQDALRSLSIDVLRPRPKIVACAGAATCRLGLCLSPHLASAIEARLREAGLDGTPPCPPLIKGGEGGGATTIRISGCLNSCGNHSVAAIGLEGKVMRHHGRSMPCYEVVAGGKSAEGSTQFAQRLGTVPAKEVPGLLLEAISRGLTSADDLRKLVAARTDIPANAPDDYYVDFGAVEIPSRDRKAAVGALADGRGPEF